MDPPARPEVLREPIPMQDLLFVALTIAFFALAAGYVRFCDRIR
jgi:hypothetical protein